MIDVNPNHLDTVTRILAGHVPECEVRAFGSRVTWTAKDYSDLDLAVVGARALDPDALRRLKEAFEESDLPFRVEVLDWHAISSAFQGVIEKKYEVVQKGKQKSLGMAGEWPTATVRDVTVRVTKGTTPTTIGGQFVECGINFVKVESITDLGLIEQDKLAHIDEHSHALLSRSVLEQDDILFTIAGTIGRVALVPASILPANTNQAVAIVRPDQDKVLPRFLYYVLRDESRVRQAHTRVVQSVQANFSLGELSSLDIPLPDCNDQRAIAHILGTLDDKIELNRRMNETLEAMARALFKSWFVDFDPVRAKAEGRDHGLPRPVADLFPDSFDDSELGEIPRGWEVKSFANTIEILAGGTPKTSVTEYWGGDVPWFSVVDAPTSSDVWVVDTEKKVTHAGVENSSARVLPVGTTIISARGTIGRVALVGVPMAMNQSCYGLRGLVGTQGFFNYYSTRELVTRLQQHAHGSVFDTITRDTLAGVSVVVPPGQLIEHFEKGVGPSLERIRAGLLEARTLATLRDTLLPKLISGELRVGDVEPIAVSAMS